MGSDKARISYNARQQYRAVIQQQGRVTLEADGNEAQQLASEDLRLEALDFVGPTGTPDNGYQILLAGATPPDFDFAILPGTMYVGGQRVVLPAPADGGNVCYRRQPDWIDPPAPQPTPPGHEFIFLHLQEQEISAIEDADLKDVALGGPDTAARLRLIQQIRRWPTQAATCADALAAATAEWQTQGVDFDPQTMRLLPRALLKVSFQNLAGLPDLCEPAAQGGYLGAENQLIRVKVTASDRLVWGYDNASFLYRVAEMKPDNRTLVLRPRPVDAPHQPRKEQAVELLRSLAQLSNGEYVAAADGLVQKLSNAYDPDTQQVALPTALPAEYLLPEGTPRLFVRIWEEEVTFAANTPVSLGETGLQVTLQTSSGAFHIGDSWSFAVRPSTPTEIYPQRYRDNFQPVEGPRQWICPLAVIGWNDGVGAVLEDCRNFFDNLVELTKRKAGGCGCCVTLGSEDVDNGAGLQAAIDHYVDLAKGVPVTLSLKPGRYRLPSPLRLGEKHRFFTLEGCDSNVILEAQEGQEIAFSEGLIALAESANVTLRRLNFLLSKHYFYDSGGRLLAMDLNSLVNLVKFFQTDVDDFYNFYAGMTVSIGVRGVACDNLTVQGCLFTFQPMRSTEHFQVGIFLSGGCQGLRVIDNRFLQPEPYHPEEPSDRPPFTFGVLHTPALKAEISVDGEVASITGGVLLSRLDQAQICANDFQGLGAAALFQTETGEFAIDHNRVRTGYAGFLLFARDSFRPDLAKENHPWSSSVQDVLHEPLIAVGTFLGRVYPFIEHFNADPHMRFGDARVGPSSPIPIPPDRTSGFVALNLTVLRALEETVLKPIPVTLNYNLHFGDNSIEAQPVLRSSMESPSMSGCAIILWNDERNPGSMIVNANRALNSSFKNRNPTALIIVAGSCSVTGGTFQNIADTPGPCLVIGSLIGGNADYEPPIAVTGNVFVGEEPQLPKRPDGFVTSPMTNWRLFNAWLPDRKLATEPNRV